MGIRQQAVGISQVLVVIGFLVLGAINSHTLSAAPQPAKPAVTAKKPATKTPAKKPAAKGTPANKAPAAANTPERGKLEQGHVRLCPGETYQMDLYPQLEYQVGARYNATVVSSNPTRVQATTQVDQRNHAILHVRAGQNESEQEQVVRLTITAHIDRLNVGIPPQQRGPGQGIHGSGPNSVPHAIDPASTNTRTGVIDIHVLGKRQCAQQPEPVAQTPQPVRDPSWYRIEYTACTNSWTGDAIRERGPGVDLPPVRRVQVQSNSNPAVATLKVFGVPNQGDRFRYPVILSMKSHGVEGEAVIRLIEVNPPVNTQAYHREIVVKVSHCDNPPPTVDIIERTNAAIKKGGFQYKEIPPAPGPAPSWLDED